jgi:hypothetical protein
MLPRSLSSVNVLTDSIMQNSSLKVASHINGARGCFGTALFLYSHKTITGPTKFGFSGTHRLNW